MTERVLTASLAATAVTLSVTSSLLGLYRADAAEQEDECAPKGACVETAEGQVPIAEFDAECSGSTPQSDLKAFARARSERHGWSEGQHSHLLRLWTRESRWEWDATNPTSGAYGIPQSLPPRKLASAGKDWKTNPCTQIRWGVNYIKKRYDTPAQAWAFWQQHHWY